MSDGMFPVLAIFIKKKNLELSHSSSNVQMRQYLNNVPMWF